MPETRGGQHADIHADVEAIVQDGDGWLRLREPFRIVAAERPEDVRPALREVERLTRDHACHAAGWVSFEAASGFGLTVKPPQRRFPLVWFGLFRPATVRLGPAPNAGDAYQLGPITPLLDRDAFRRLFIRVREHIAAGNSYQANLTFQTRADFSGDPRTLFADLVEAQGGRYSAFFSVGSMAVCSASPELFFELDGLAIRTRIMKGTARRGLTPAADEEARLRLATSAKERAENVMIVDMMRNDLGRIAEVGSVSVPSLCDVERYPAVWQMTSRVNARSTASLDEIFAALHPSASVTGAPKVRTLEILAELEPQSRGLYTGAIGHIAPNGNARFNVAIRTAIVDRTAGAVHFGVGSGIVWDSEADAEYDECLLKGAILGRRPIAFELLETMRWTPDEGFFLLARHLERVEASAHYFDVPYERNRVEEALATSLAGQSEPRRVRLLVDRRGHVRVEHARLVRSPDLLRVALASSPVNRLEPWLFHKTTHRTIYEDARRAHPTVDDVVLWNERGEITEGTIANVVVEVDGVRVTPPVECGLLAGTFRAEMLARGEIKEAVIPLAAVKSAPMWLINSVHEWRRAEVMA